MIDSNMEPEIMQSSWCGFIYTRDSDVNHMHHLEFTYLIVCDLCKNTEGFLNIDLLFSCQKAVVLQDVELDVSARCLRL